MATYTLTASQLQGAGILNVFDIPDANAQAYLTATGISDTLQQNIVAELVRDLKNYGIWSKMKAVYPFVTDNRNLFSYTEDFGNGVWTSTGATVTLNTTISPNGTLTADTIKEDSSTAQHRSYQFFNATAGVSYTASIFCKAGVGTRNIAILYGCGFGSDNRVIFNVNNGTIVASSGASGTITSVGNGWYRCTASATASASVSTCLQYQLRDGTTEIYTGDNTSSLIIWGAQLELGSTATTYQPIATTQQAYISNQFKYNLVNPVDSDAAFRLVFNGGWTFDSTGATPNGTNGYADTKLNPIVQNIKESYGVYTRTSDGSGVRILIGCREGTKQNYISPSITTLNIRGTLGSSTGLLSNSKGFIMGYDLDDTSNQYTNINGVKFSGTRTFNGSPNFNFFISAWNNDGSPSFYSSAEMSFAFISDRLTDNQAANLYTAVQAFQTKLSRQV